MRPPLYRLSYIATSRPQSAGWYQTPGYDSGMTLENDRLDDRVDLCSRCGRICEPAELGNCPVCGRTFCLYCVYRVGSRSYCSRPCGDSFFFGSDVDDEDIPEE